MEVEVETNLVLNKHIKLRVSNGTIVSGNLMVYECEEPYVLVITVLPDDQPILSDDDVIRTDVFKEDLSRELKHWLDGKYIHHPAALVPVRVDDAIMKFIKFAKTPKQEDLIMWILSRSELHKVNGAYQIIFGGIDLDDQDEDIDKLKMSIHNRYNKTASVAAAMSSQDDANYQLGKTKESLPPETLKSGVSMPKNPLKPQHNEDLGMFEMTRKLLGRSATLEGMKTQRMKGREGARRTLTGNTILFDPDAYRLVNEIERTRKDIVQKMDERRRMIEVAKVRQMQSAEKYRKISGEVHSKRDAEKFMQHAQQELLTLQNIEFEINDDIMKQKTRIQRGTQKVIWTKAPNGFNHLRGKSMKGPVIGPGPLPPNATTALKDPIIERTIQNFYWDQSGRRHTRASTAHINDSDESSLVELAMNAIRRAAANISAFKLDLKAVFQQFDTSGDGFLSPVEMAQAFLSMGIKLDIPSIEIIFKHFDPNNSGSVHYGEFVWAFFNRRSLVRQWRHSTKTMTKKEILNRFHNADVNGNGRLNQKEFIKLLKKFGISLPEKDVEILMDRFDLDGDGEIDLQEFYGFIESEEAQLRGQTLDSSSSPSSSSPNPRPTMAGTSRPASAPRPQRSVANHNVTAPAALQRRPETSQSGKENQKRNPAVTEEHPRPPRVLRKDTVAAERSLTESIGVGDIGADEHLSTASPPPDYHTMVAKTTNAGDDDDVLWMSRMLQAQAEIESRLGNRYFRTRQATPN